MQSSIASNGTKDTSYILTMNDYSQYINDPNNYIGIERCLKEMTPEQRYRFALQKDKNGNSPLHILASFLIPNFIKLLCDGLTVREKWEIFKQKNFNEENFLLTFMRRNRDTFIDSSEIMKQIFSAVPGYRMKLLNLKNKEGRTPLLLAIHDRQYRQVQAILEILDNDPYLIRNLLYATDKLGRSPMHLAIKNKNSELLKQLLTYAEDRWMFFIMQKDEYGNNLLLEAVASNCSPEMIQEILKDIEDPDVLQYLIVKCRNEKKQNALDLSADNPEITALLESYLKKYLPPEEKQSGPYSE